MAYGFGSPLVVATEAKDIAVEVAKILASSVTLCVGIAFEEVIQKALEAIPC